MSWCEDYNDPLPDACDHGFPLGINCHDCDHDLEDDDDHWTCLYPDRCLMPAMHCRDECHTVEDVEAYYAEVEGIAPLQTENPPDTLRE